MKAFLILEDGTVFEGTSIVSTKDMIIDDVIRLDERLGEVFMGFGMHCIFCHLGLEETVEEAANVHEVDVDFLVKKLNEVYNQYHKDEKDKKNKK